MGSALLDVSAMSGWMPAAVVAACVILLYVRSPSYEVCPLASCGLGPSLTNAQLSHIPTAGGPSLPLLSYIGSKRFVQHAREILQEGYEKAGLFRMRRVQRRSDRRRCSVSWPYLQSGDTRPVDG
jgi:hypothetical protein